ncbi:hypothetical protein [Actinomadura sp. 21ATH]|uniref:hypothetical protein n=1 Tax=Actinomadura sp. 21ATH TaxID=1735444 RepID=UPI0035C00254
MADRIGGLSDHAFDVRVGSVRDAEELSPADLAEALESLTGVMDEIWHTLSPFQERLETIRKGETVARAHTGRSVHDLVDSAAVNLDYGRDGLMVARHLIAEGRADLIAAEREGGIG